MARIPFPRGFEGSESLPRTNRNTQNCFNNGTGQILQTPGITELNTTSRIARGSFVWNDSLYIVATGDLLKITDIETGAFSVIGTIEGSANIVTAVGFNDAVIVVKGGSLYTLDKSDVLTDISSNSNFVPCVDVTHINGRFVYIPSDGSVAFFSDVGLAGTVQPLSFFDAEELPDKNSGCFNLSNTLFILGTDSIELFRDTGATPNPFTRVTGSRIQNGFISGLQEYGATFLFVGREKDQDKGIYSVAPGQAVKISNETVDLVLNSYTLSELQDCIPGRFKWRGYDIATFTFPNDSFGFWNGNWFPMETFIGGRSQPWAGGFITQFQGSYYSAYNDKIGKLDKVNKDYGNPKNRVIDLGFEQEDGDRFSCQSIEVGVSQGFNSSVGSVSLQMSDDNVLYKQPIFINLGDLGEYTKKLIWNPAGGLGNYNGFMGARISTAEDVDFSMDYVVANIR